MVICVLYPRFELLAALGDRGALLSEPAALAPEAGREQVVGEVEPGTVTITVRVPGAGLAGEHRIELHAERWVAVSVVDGAIVFRDQDTLFGYV